MSRPNIVLVLIDDLGWTDLGCYGSSFYETPCLDRLASEGVRFTHAYAAAPVCSPTRASILSGRYPARLGLTTYLGSGQSRGRLIDAPYADHLGLEETSLASALKQHGYHTWHVGKWHLGPAPYYPEAHGFDVNVAGSDWGHPRHGYFSPYHLDTLDDGPPGEYLTDRLTDEAIRLIQGREDQNPFFLYLAHYAVHTPIEGPPELINKYIHKAKSLGLDRVNALEEGGFFPTDERKGRRIVRRTLQSDVHYAAMVENLDANLERLFQALDDVGETDHTMVIFTSDNGGLSTAEGAPTCNAPLLEGKGWMYDGGLRVPLIVKWPGVTKEGRVCTTPVISPDFYPTILDLAGLALKPEQHVDGETFAGDLIGEKFLAERSIYWHFPHYANQGGTPGAAVRRGDYKLIEFYEDKRLELYDVVHDPGEEHDLAAKMAEKALALHADLQQWRQALKASLPSINPEYHDEDG